MISPHEHGLGVVLAVVLVTVATAPAVVAGATTTVSLDPVTDTLQTGETTAVDVVVESTDGGVGAYTATVSLDDPDAASITDVDVAGEPGLVDISIADDGSTATIDAALMDTDDEGSVDVATVTVAADSEGTTGVSLSVEALGDEEGNSYQVADTVGTTLTVTDRQSPPPDPDSDPSPSTGLSVAQEPPGGTAEPGGTMTFVTTVDAAELNAAGLDVTLPEGWSITSQSATGPATYRSTTSEWVWLSGGEYTVTYTVAVPDDAAGSHSIGIRASAVDPASGDRVVETTDAAVTVAGSTGPQGAQNTYDVTVESTTIGPGGAAVLDVTLPDAVEGLSSYELVVAVENPSVGRIVDADYPGTLSVTTEPDLSIDGSTARLEAVDVGKKIQPGDVGATLGTVWISAENYGSTNVSVNVVRMDDDDGAPVATATTAGRVTISPPAVGPGSSPADVDGDGHFEDVNGNGQVDFDDVVTLFNNMNDSAVRNNPALYDFNDNGRIDFDDVVTLSEEA